MLPVPGVGSHSKELSKKRAQAGVSTGRVLKIDSPTFNLPVLLEERPVNALVDTGASVSCVDDGYVDVSKRCKSAFVALRGANGSSLTVLGTCEFELECEKQRFKQKFYVVRKLLVPVILGMDFLESHHAQLDCTSRRVQLRPIESVAIVVSAVSDGP